MDFPHRIYLGLEQQKRPASLPKDLPISTVDIDTASDYAGSTHVLEMGKILMKLRFFGDSYDIVKKSLIAWLSEFGIWSTHPIFTEPVTQNEAQAFARFLGVQLLSIETITPKTDRAKYFSSCATAGNLFLDPDTGVRINGRRGLKSVNYVFAAELVDWSHARPTALTMVFDQSYSRGPKIITCERNWSFLHQTASMALHIPHTLRS